MEQIQPDGCDAQNAQRRGKDGEIAPKAHQGEKGGMARCKQCQKHQQKCPDTKPQSDPDSGPVVRSCNS